MPHFLTSRPQAKITTLPRYELRQPTLRKKRRQSQLPPTLCNFSLRKPAAGHHSLNLYPGEAPPKAVAEPSLKLGSQPHIISAPQQIAVRETRERRLLIGEVLNT